MILGTTLTPKIIESKNLKNNGQKQFKNFLEEGLISNGFGIILLLNFNFYSLKFNLEKDSDLLEPQRAMPYASLKIQISNIASISTLNLPIYVTSHYILP